MNKCGYIGEKLYTSAVHFYGSMDEMNNAFKIVIKMDEDIEPIALRHALDKCQERYPYLMVKVKKSLMEWSLEYNEKPVVIINTKVNVLLGSEQTNKHIIAFTYYENVLTFVAFHGLMDGNGAYTFLRTLMYYYVSEAYGEQLSSKGIRLLEDEIDPEEYLEPVLALKVDKDTKALVENKKKNPSFRIEKADSRVNKSVPYYFYVKMPQSTLIKYCKANDASPATLFSLLLARTIKKLNPDATDIRGGLANDQRPALGVTKTHHSNIGVLELDFDEKVQRLEFEKQNTAFRGKTILLNDPENILAGLKGTKMFYDIINKVPFAGLKKAILQKIIKMNLGQQTYMVSYVGKSGFGDAEKHIKEIYNEADAPGTNLMLEVASLNDIFCLCFVQEWKEKLYFEEFCKEMDDIGLEYEVVQEGDYYVTPVRI